MRFIILTLISLSLLACSSLSKSPETLRHNYLVITPYGISMDEAVPLIKKQIAPKGSLYVRNNKACLDKEELSKQKGRHSIKVDLGWYYWGSVQTNMYAEWCFNSDEKLIDIIVYRSIEDSSNYGY